MGAGDWGMGAGEWGMGGCHNRIINNFLLPTHNSHSPGVGEWELGIGSWGEGAEEWKLGSARGPQAGAVGVCK